MRRRITSLCLAGGLVLGGTGGLLLAASPAYAAITTSTNNGHPNTNPAGNCPTGQNKDATPGALNKC